MTAESVMNDVGEELLSQARKLVAAGRKSEVVTRLDMRLERQRKPGDSQEAMVWNSFLDQVLAQL